MVSQLHSATCIQSGYQGGLHTLEPTKARCIISASLQAFDLGQWALARRVLEMGLCCNPRHLLMLQRLAEVLVLLGDWGPAMDVLIRLLEQVGCS